MNGTNRFLGTEKDQFHQQAGWRPTSLKLPAMITLIIFLAATLAAASAIYAYSRGSALYQTFFVYQKSVTVGSDRLGDVGPTPIITTLLAVMIGLWWGSLETNMRRLQPFIVMSKAPAALSRGAALSYQSSYSIWAALRASSKGHWLLASLSFASFLSQILTISMSALWQRDYGIMQSSIKAPRQLELRKIPFVTQGQIEPTVHGQAYQGNVLRSLYTDLQTNWLYGASIQLSLNGTEPAWSSDGWSFVPLDLTSVRNSTIQNYGSSPSQSGLSGTSEAGTNVTMSTQGIRARLECSPYKSLTNTSNWLRKQHLRNSSVWNVTANPQGLATGYELGCGVPDTLELGYAMPTINIFPNNTNPDTCGGSWYTSFFANPSRLVCCVNDTSSTPGPASIGYWSANLPYQEVDLWSFPEWPYNFTVKWIHGSQMEEYHQVNDSLTAHLIFSQKPDMTALNCLPVIERANASVMVDHVTGRVQSFNITDDPQPDPNAWSHVFRTWTNSDASPNEGLYINVTTR